MVPQAILEPELPVLSLMGEPPTPKSSTRSCKTTERPMIESDPKSLSLFDVIWVTICPLIGETTTLPRSPSWLTLSMGPPWRAVPVFQCGPADSQALLFKREYYLLLFYLNFIFSTGLLSVGSELTDSMPNLWTWIPCCLAMAGSVGGKKVTLTLTTTGLLLA